MVAECIYKKRDFFNEEDQVDAKRRSKILNP
jgi:hypothetical protein